MTREKERSLACLKDLWFSLIEEESIQSKDADDNYQGLMMLLEIALSKAKRLSFYNYNLKTSNERILSELDWKTKEYNKLKTEIQRLENSPCEKCSTLEAEMKSLKKKATEAQSRMRSIANILKLGENIEESQSPRKNSALTLVSQMLLEESPRRKKRCLSKTSNTWKETDLKGEEDIRNCTTLIPDNIDLIHKSAPSEKKKENTEMIMSPGDAPIQQPKENISNTKPTLIISLPSPKEISKQAKKNLSSRFEKETIESPKSSINVIPETEQNTELNGSLAEYVREANSELDKIWFTASTSKSLENTVVNEKDSRLKGDMMVDVTPERTPKKSKTIWKMKEVHGPAEFAGNKKVRQLTLSFRTKQKTKEVDLSTLTGFDGGSVAGKDSTPSSGGSRSPLKERDNLDPALGNMEESEVDTNVFKPKATSTQKVDFDLVNSKAKKGDSPNYKYKRDTVRKKSERAKLEGWDCEKCAEYYAACGETSPSKVKNRMNKCSRHRDKFKPISNTPPGYWNPIFPDTEECKDKGMYISYHEKKNDL